MILSIVTINFNNAEGLKKTLASVAAQTVTEFEHVVVDGASSDGSADIIREYAEKASYPVRWVSEPDKGIYNAMNKGIRMAIGKYIQILNSGDMYASSNVVEQMNNALITHNNPPILYGNMIKRWPNGKEVCDRGSAKKDKEWTMFDFIRGTVNHDPTYIHRNLYERLGLYREDLPITADWRWFVEAIPISGIQPVYVPIDVTVFDMTGISETQIERRERERRKELAKILYPGVLRDYELYHFPIQQIKRLKKYHIWGVVYFVERVLFKLEKWRILR